jgi:hypothetical protein
LQELKELFQKTTFTRKRTILSENIEENFRVLESHGLSSLKDILDALKTKPKITNFSEKTGLSREYFVVLRRQVQGYVPKPVKLDKLPCITSNTNIERYLDNLKQLGIINTFNMLEMGRTKQEREEISQKATIPSEFLLNLVKYSDLYRIGALRDVRARMYFETGIDTAEKIANSDPKQLYEFLKGVSKKFDFIKIDPPIGDLQGNIKLANRIVKRLSVEY